MKSEREKQDGRHTTVLLLTELKDDPPAPEERKEHICSFWGPGLRQDRSSELQGSRSGAETLQLSLPQWGGPQERC